MSKRIEEVFIAQKKINFITIYYAIVLLIVGHIFANGIVSVRAAVIERTRNGDYVSPKYYLWVTTNKHQLLAANAAADSAVVPAPSVPGPGPVPDSISVSIPDYKTSQIFTSDPANNNIVLPQLQHEQFLFADINFTYLNPGNGSPISISDPQSGRYGNGIAEPVRGILYHVSSEKDANNHTGCELPFLDSKNRRSYLSNRTAFDQNWVALIERGSCNFVTKLRNAILSNASGVIIYNDNNIDFLEKMKLTSDDSNENYIGTILTFQRKGKQLANLVDNGIKVHVSFAVSSKPEPIATLNQLSLWLVSTTFMVLWILSISWLIFYYIQRFRYLYAKDRISRHLCNAAKKALSNIPVKTIKSDDKEIQGECESCAICIELYKVTDILRVLPCNHEFHKTCIDPWLLSHRTCPMCKMNILKYYGFSFTNSEENIIRITLEEANSFAQSPSQQNQLEVVPVVEVHQTHTSPTNSVQTGNSSVSTINVEENGSVMCHVCSLRTDNNRTEIGNEHI